MPYVWFSVGGSISAERGRAKAEEQGILESANGWRSCVYNKKMVATETCLLHDDDGGVAVRFGAQKRLHTALCRRVASPKCASFGLQCGQIKKLDDVVHDRTALGSYTYGAEMSSSSLIHTLHLSRYLSLFMFFFFFQSTPAQPNPTISLTPFNRVTAHKTEAEYKSKRKFYRKLSRLWFQPRILREMRFLPFIFIIT